MKKIKIFFKILIFLLSFNEVLKANESIKDIPTIDLKLYQYSKSITAPIDGEIILSNFTNNSYDIHKVTIYLPQGISALRKKYTEDIADTLHTISANDEIIYSFNVPRVKMSFFKELINLDTLLFIPGSYRFRAEIILNKSDNTKVKRTLYSIKTVKLEASLSAVLRGGIIGAFLLGLFVPSYRMLNNIHQNTRNEKKVNAISQFFIYFISGSVVATTAILFLYRMGSANLPISIDVNDYLGGIVIGLLSYLFGDTLYKKFFHI